MSIKRSNNRRYIRSNDLQYPVNSGDRRASKYWKITKLCNTILTRFMISTMLVLLDLIKGGV